MSVGYGVKQITLDFINMSGGINTTDPVADIKENQVQYAYNAVFPNNGFSRAFGLIGLKSSLMFNSRMYGEHIYEHTDGTEELLSVVGQKLYTVDESDGSAIELFDFGGTGEAWFADYMGLCFVCNGVKMCKYDGTNAYQAGITAPSGVSAAVAAGGSLPTGVYQLYAGYARKVSGANVLYSSGQNLGSVTLTPGNQSIDITSFANSADPQVGNKVIWMTDAGGGTFYLFYQTGNNTTTSFTISDVSQRDSTKQYDILAAYNKVPSTPKMLTVFNNRTWYISENQAFFSLQAGSVYDLEKFDTEADGNILTFPYQLTGIFSVNGSICFNSKAGIILIPNGDISQQYIVKGAPYYFYDMRTVDTWSGSAIGLTNNGFKIFDGETFTSIDIARDIKSYITKCYSGTNTDFKPCGKVVRNAISQRTEYHLSFKDTSISSTNNNSTLVLDLDGLQIINADQYAIQWEKWQNGFSYITVKNDGTIYYGQTTTSESHISKNNSESTSDKWIISDSGVFLNDKTDRLLKIITKEKIPDILGYCRWMHLHIYGKVTAPVSIRVMIGDDYTREAIRSFVSESGTIPLFDETIFDETLFGQESPLRRKCKLPKKLKGGSVFLEITQTADDPNFLLNRLFLSGIIKRTRFS